MICGVSVYLDKIECLSFCQCRSTSTMCALVTAHIMANATFSMGKREREREREMKAKMLLDV